MSLCMSCVRACVSCAVMMTTSVLGQRWSLGFRPSDDACKYPFLVPSNMFAVVTLGYLAEIAERVYANGALRAEALALRQQIDDGTDSSTYVVHFLHISHSKRCSGTN